MKLILGIGNPDRQYENTRHNVGFSVVRLLSGPGHLGAGGALSWKEAKPCKARVAASGEVTLAQPTTFVNRSGESAAAFLRKFSLKAEELLIVCDDVNLRFGQIRLRKAGSAGGHHGLESVIRSVATEAFPRLRIGVGQEGMPKDLTGFVLEPFTADEKGRLPEILEKSAQVCKVWAERGFEAAANHLSL